MLAARARAGRQRGQGVPGPQGGEKVETVVLVAGRGRVAAGIRRNWPIQRVLPIRGPRQSDGQQFVVVIRYVVSHSVYRHGITRITGVSGTRLLEGLG